MPAPAPQFETFVARDPADIDAALALRYRVFVEEMGATGDAGTGQERDRFDRHADLLVLADRARPPARQIVGVYRVLDGDAAKAAGGFYSEQEYDLGPLRATGRPLMELGRSCLHPDYRGGAGLFHLWQGLASHVRARGAELLFGVASFHGTDPQAHAEPLSLLRARHLAPPGLRVRSRAYQPMDIVPATRVDRVAAARAMPALIKAYLRLGGVVGDGAYVDKAFNTTDVCLIVDTKALNARQEALYSGGAAKAEA